MFPDPWLLTFLVFAVLVALGSSSGLINERLWISEPLVCALVGVALGPVGLGLVHINPGKDPASAAVLSETARVTLAIAVAGAAIRLPRGWLRAHWRGLAAALGPGMVLMWGAGALVAVTVLGAPFLTALLIAAAVAPTDPVLSAPLLTGRLASQAVPEDLRHGLTAESGVNDGLALPLVMLPVLLLSHRPDAAWTEWLGHVLLYEIGCGIVVGAIGGWLTCRLLQWAKSRPDSQRASLLTAVIALALMVLAGARLLDSDGVLAAFVAGAVLNQGNWDNEIEQQSERFNEALARFFDLPIMILFGAVLPWHDWTALGWRGVGFALAILLLRRPPVWLLLGRLMPWTRDIREALFAGWFGPIGAAALFYAMLIQDQTGLTTIWPAVSLVVAASVLAHGATGTPLTWIFGRARSGSLQLHDPQPADNEPQTADQGGAGRESVTYPPT